MQNDPGIPFNSSNMTAISPLIKRWQVGDERAGLALYDHFGDRTFWLAYGLLGDRDDAEKVAQDALYYAMTNIARFDPDRAAFSTWLHTITVSREDVLKFHPDAPSKVVHTHHAGVWTGTPIADTSANSAKDNGLLSPEPLREMLDRSITELTGLKEPRDAWALLFSPDERIAIKVNVVSASVFRTHAPLVMAVTECLQEAGIPAEQIVIFDRFTSELEKAGYQINTGDTPGVLCRGDNDHTSGYTEGWTLMDTDIKLSNTLLNCQALINMPILKYHPHSGITFAMKNLFGTFDVPGAFHKSRTGQAIAELNALPEIKERTRLVIGDALQISPESSGGWFRAVTGDSILMSFDPVAHDAVGLGVLGEVFVSEGNDARVEHTANLARPWLTYSAELGLGTNDPANIDLKEVNLG
jgi:uncharacterized protein (DUF362 family)